MPGLLNFQSTGADYMFYQTLRANNW
ncbi:MAG: serine/threonine-protein phosphatase, partial [Pantoea sp. Morm]|nr:serine/threonine-protein phosphatase [Pantoea sp. Morm]